MSSKPISRVVMVFSRHYHLKSHSSQLSTALTETSGYGGMIGMIKVSLLDHAYSVLLSMYLLSFNTMIMLRL